MKKLFKQSLAVLLSATLLLTAAPFASSAAEMAPQEESVAARRQNIKRNNMSFFIVSSPFLRSFVNKSLLICVISLKNDVVNIEV